MNRSETIASIVAIVNRVIEDKGERPVAIDPETPFLGGPLPIDSLDLATIVVELEAVAGTDPFKDGFIEFRTDWFNAPNRVQLTGPVTDLTNANFGRVTGQRSARVIQLGIRYAF